MCNILLIFLFKDTEVETGIHTHYVFAIIINSFVQKQLHSLTPFTFEVSNHQYLVVELLLLSLFWQRPNNTLEDCIIG